MMPAFYAHTIKELSELFNAPLEDVIKELIAEGLGPWGLEDKLGLNGATVKRLCEYMGIELPKQKSPIHRRIEKEYGIPLKDVLIQLRDEGLNWTNAAVTLDCPLTTLKRWCAEYDLTFTRSVKRPGKQLVHGGISDSVAGWAVRLGIHENTLRKRLDQGLPLALVLQPGRVPPGTSATDLAVLKIASEEETGVDLSWVVKRLTQEEGKAVSERSVRLCIDRLTSLARLRRSTGDKASPATVYRLTDEGRALLAQ